MTTTAQHALKALQMKKRNNGYMARMYALKHGALGAYRLACQLEAMSRCNN